MRISSRVAAKEILRHNAPRSKDRSSIDRISDKSSKGVESRSVPALAYERSASDMEEIARQAASLTKHHLGGFRDFSSRFPWAAETLARTAAFRDTIQPGEEKAKKGKENARTERRSEDRQESRESRRPGPSNREEHWTAPLEAALPKIMDLMDNSRRAVNQVAATANFVNAFTKDSTVEKITAAVSSIGNGAIGAHKFLSAENGPDRRTGGRVFLRAVEGFPLPPKGKTRTQALADAGNAALAVDYAAEKSERASAASGTSTRRSGQRRDGRGERHRDRDRDRGRRDNNRVSERSPSPGPSGTPGLSR